MLTYKKKMIESLKIKEETVIVPQLIMLLKQLDTTNLHLDMPESLNF